MIKASKALKLLKQAHAKKAAESGDQIDALVKEFLVYADGEVRKAIEERYACKVVISTRGYDQKLPNASCIREFHHKVEEALYDLGYGPSTVTYGDRLELGLFWNQEY